MTSIEMENLCPVKIAEEYKKNPLLKSEDVATLREWVLSVPSYPKNIPDILYAIFLGSSNFNVEEAKVYIDNSIKVRTEAPELFSNRDPQNPNIKAIWELIDAWVTPKATPDNYRILYSGFVNPDPTTYSFSEACKVFVMVGEAYVLQNGTTPGIIVVLDAKGGSYRHLLKAKMHTINKFLFYVQEAIPCHIAQVHVININPVIDKIMFLIKPFIKKALMENIYFHTSDLTEFYKRVPKDVLPSDLGGNSNITRKELQQETLANFDSLREWFIQEGSLRLNYDDKIKNQRKQSNSKLEETETSFKSLSID